MHRPTSVPFPELQPQLQLLALLQREPFHLLALLRCELWHEPLQFRLLLRMSGANADHAHDREGKYDTHSFGSPPHDR